MARIEDIKHRLERWSRWVNERDSGGLGFARKVSWLRIGSTRPGQSTTSLADTDAMTTDQAVRALEDASRILFDTVICFYGKGYDYKRTAREMRRAESTVRRNLELADVKIQAWLIEHEERKNQHRIAA